MGDALSDARACARCSFEFRRRGAVFDPQISDEDLGSGRVDVYDYQSVEDQELFDELETLKWHGLNDFGWVVSKHTLGTRRLSEKQRNKQLRNHVHLLKCDSNSNYLFHDFPTGLNEHGRQSSKTEGAKDAESTDVRRDCCVSTGHLFSG
jgi:hypothetical protein